MTKEKVRLAPKEVKRISLEIFKKIEEVCEELNIDCWVMYGTLIGAVRHGGFIPWDDDFDVAMRREDYEKFIDYCHKNKSALSPYYVDHFSFNNDYPFYIARVCDPNYTLIFENLKYSSGIFIDIYPFDGMGNDLDFWKKENSSKNRTDIEKAKTMVWVRNLKNPFVGRNILFKIVRGLLAIYSKTRSKVYWMNKLDKISKVFNWEDSKYVGLSTWSTKVYGLQREWFDKTTYLKFENTTVPVPSEYKKVLKEIYGDYMSLPPKEQQVPTHWYTAYKNE